MDVPAQDDLDGGGGVDDLAERDPRLDAGSSDGRQCTFEELCPQGLVAPEHVHPDEDEAFFVLEGEFVFTVGDDEVPAPWE